MDYITMTRTSLRKNAKKYLTFLIICIIAIMLQFLYSTIIYNGHGEIIKRGGILGMILRSSIDIIIVMLAFFTIYSYNSYIKLRIKEFKIILLLGATKGELKLCLFIENLLLTSFCLGVGLILGSIFSKLFFLVIVSYLGVPNAEFSLGLINYLSALELFVLLYIIMSFRTSRVIKHLTEIHISLRGKWRERCIEAIKLIILLLHIALAMFEKNMEAKNPNSFYFFVWICCMTIIYISVVYLSRVASYLMKKRNSFYSRNFLLVKQVMRNIEKDKVFIFAIAYISFWFITYNWIGEVSVISDYSKAVSAMGSKIFRLIALISNVLFFGISSSVIYFKAKMEMDEVSDYMKKLYLLGATKKEINLLIKYRLISMFFTPCTISIVTSLIFTAFIGPRVKLIFFTRIIIVICYFFHIYGYERARRLYGERLSI